MKGTAAGRAAGRTGGRTGGGTADGRDRVFRPHPVFVLISTLPFLAGLAGVCLVAVLGSLVWQWAGLGAGLPAAWIFAAGVIAALARVVWAVAVWASRLYGFTDGVVWAEFGVLNRRRNELRIERIQSSALDRPLLERVCGVGSIGFATAGTPGFEVVWGVVGHPRARLAMVREALDAAEQNGPGGGSGRLERVA